MVGVFNEADDLVFHEEVEVGVLCGLGGEEVEEVPLRHESDELFVGGEVGEIGDGKVFAADGEDELGDSLVGKGEEGVEDAQLVHEVEGGGVDGVAAEVAKEVFVLFEDGDVVAVSGEEIAEHHAGWASAYDAAGGFGDRHRWDEGSKGGMGGQKVVVLRPRGGNRNGYWWDDNQKSKSKIQGFFASLRMTANYWR